MHEPLPSRRDTAELPIPQQAAGHPWPPVPRRRVRVAAAIALLLLWATVLLLFFQVHGFLDRVEAQLRAQATSGDGRIRAIRQQMDALQDKFNALLAESVEVRLKNLEKSVAVGRVGAEDLKAFQELKDDLRALETYAARNEGQGLDTLWIDHPRLRPVPEPRRAVRPDQLMDELAALRGLFQLCLVAVTLGTLVICGYWVYRYRSLRRLAASTQPPPLLPDPSRERRS